MMLFKQLLFSVSVSTLAPVAALAFTPQLLSLNLVFDEAPTAVGIEGSFTLSGEYSLGSIGGSQVVPDGATVGTPNFIGSIPLDESLSPLAFGLSLRSFSPVNSTLTFLSGGQAPEDSLFPIEQLRINFSGPSFSPDDPKRLTGGMFFEIPDRVRAEELFSLSDVSFLIEASGRFAIQERDLGDFFDTAFLNDTFTRPFGDPDLFTVTTSVIPEPGHYALFVGLGGLLFAFRRQRRK